MPSNKITFPLYFKEINCKHAIILLGILVFTYYNLLLYNTGEALSSDIASYIVYFRAITSGDYYATWTTPKPLNILLIGSLYQIFNSMYAVALFYSICTSLLYIISSCILYELTSSYLAITILLITISSKKIFVDSVLSGGSGILSTLIIFSAVLRIVKITKSNSLHLYDPILIILLFIAGIDRPDNWILILFIIVILVIYKKINSEKLILKDYLILLPMLTPFCWHLIDYLLFNDLFYSSKVTKGYLENSRVVFGRFSDEITMLNYFKTVGSFFHNNISYVTVALAILGIPSIISSKSKSKILTVMLLTAVIVGTNIFYFATYMNNMALLDRFYYSNYLICIILAIACLINMLTTVNNIPNHAFNVTLKTLIVLMTMLFIYLHINISNFSMILNNKKSYNIYINNATRIANTIKLDKDYTNISSVVAPAEMLPRILVELHNNYCESFPVRLIAGFPGSLIGRYGIYDIMTEIAANRKYYHSDYYSRLNMHYSSFKTMQYKPITVFLIYFRDMHGKEREIADIMISQAKHVETIADNKDYKLYKLSH